MFFVKKIERSYRKRVYTRFDDNGYTYYFSADDFEGLQTEKYDFVSEQGNRLSGHFYYYPEYLSDRIIVFDHGMGGGHRSYMKEIEMLAKHGYRVFAYDHTGCMESEGESINGFSQSLSDLNVCLSALKSNNEYKNISFSVVGHSWGAYSCLNIGAFHPDIKHVVAISGYVSVDSILRQTFGGLLSVYRKHFLDIESKANKKYYRCKADESLNKTEAKLLVIHSSDDTTVSRQSNYDYLSKKLAGRPGTKFVLVDNKCHNPNYTVDAVNYMKSFFADLSLARKEGKLSSASDKKNFVSRYDWNRMTAQDELVWSEIFGLLAE